MRIRTLRYTVTFILPILALLGLVRDGLWTWSVPILAFAIIPVLELMLGHSDQNLTNSEEHAALEDPIYDALLYLIFPVQWVLLVLFLIQVQETDLLWWEVMGRIATMGMLCGIYGINVAHELGHRAKRWERDLARALLLTSLYMHFIIEHNRGHHRHVATPEDPASARYGETLFAFWFRSIVYSFVSAWRIEADRMRKLNKAAYGIRNEMLQAIAWQAVLLVVIGLAFGNLALFSFIGAALTGILLLETVNDIEHYGLRRKRTASGNYGRVQHVHSWNSNHLLGRLMLFELTRHSDHHWKASKKYQVLQSLEDAPQLPTGYPGMMVLSLIPPVFFNVMHPRLKAMVQAHDTLDPPT
ncbi:MAG: alkane 1-monooxygenase [Flavobacteriales bacterium]|nr:alkane 1-monooxygenase [Flavobacteriales bacterium]MBK6945061.1 alkane 1-monooxygenase [Flavobacteriales bacterium]MBK7239410.1 alkane 1-monooxygenase [Flavobacteriales bacterium]MBK9535384.1 alkane 1-monooxygenase [Flavobacteriales bacterium]MBP9137591.1 alkane 1-monooxygenase [Flavobacteriales bacterium]